MKCAYKTVWYWCARAAKIWILYQVLGFFMHIGDSNGKGRQYKGKVISCWVSNLSDCLHGAFCDQSEDKTTACTGCHMISTWWHLVLMTQQHQSSHYIHRVYCERTLHSHIILILISPVTMVHKAFRVLISVYFDQKTNTAYTQWGLLLKVSMCDLCMGSLATRLCPIGYDKGRNEMCSFPLALREVFHPLLSPSVYVLAYMIML